MNVTQKSSGHLECRDCGLGTNWCQHIQEVCEAGADAALIWKQQTDITTGEIRVQPALDRIQIPYVPTQQQYVRVQFEDENLGNWKMFYIGRDGQDHSFIGFVSPGEGRAVMRTMVHAWFWPRIDTKAECKAAGHSFVAQQTWERDIKSGSNSARHLAQRFSIHATDLCLVCAGIASTDDADLIPDVGGGRRWR